MTQLFRAVGAAACVLLLPLTACATQSGAQNEKEIAMDGRPSMETVLDSYEAMQVELVEALEADPGGLVWEPDTEGFGLTRARCPDASATAQKATFRTLFAEGAYEGAARDRSVQVVEEVGARYGFDEVQTVVDQEDDLSIVVEDKYGARLYYGTAVNTTIMVMTGCHEWETTPGEDYDRPPVIDRPDADA